MKQPSGQPISAETPGRSPPSRDYELLDFGAGRKLERFGDVIIDRPCPTADGYQQHTPPQWGQAWGRFERATPLRGSWHWRQALPDDWSFAALGCRLQLEPTASGQIGVFPEQFANWQWITERCREFPGTRVLNLFAYTGGSTLAAASGEASVTHVDASASVVRWARRNAVRSGLESKPIRWIVEDALTFVRREHKRGRSYQGLILDPPSYGHGPKGQAWKVERDLPPLLHDLAELTRDGLRWIVLTCHTPEYSASRLKALVRAAWPRIDEDRFEFHGQILRSVAGASLPAGAVVRVGPGPDHV